MARELRALGITQDSEDEESKAKSIRPRLTRERKALGTTSTGTGSSNENEGKADTSSEDNEPPRREYSAITSDPVVPTTFEEAFFGPKSNVWRPAIYEELMSFISRRAFRKRDKKQVIE
jgi:hypothetical protein